MFIPLLGLYQLSFRFSHSLRKWRSYSKFIKTLLEVARKQLTIERKKWEEEWREGLKAFNFLPLLWLTDALITPFFFYFIVMSSLSLINSFNKEFFFESSKTGTKLVVTHKKFSQKQWNYRSTWAKYKFKQFPVMYDFPITHLAHTRGSFRMKKVPHFHIILRYRS